MPYSKRKGPRDRRTKERLLDQKVKVINGTLIGKAQNLIKSLFPEDSTDDGTVVRMSESDERRKAARKRRLDR